MTSPCIEECATFFAPLASPLREGQIQLPATCEQKNSLSLSAKTRSFPPPCPLTCGLCFSQVGNGVKFVLQSFCIGICQPKRSRMFKELLVLQPPRWLVGKQSHTKKWCWLQGQNLIEIELFATWWTTLHLALLFNRRGWASHLKLAAKPNVLARMIHMISS